MSWIRKDAKRPKTRRSRILLICMLTVIWLVEGALLLLAVVGIVIHNPAFIFWPFSSSG